MTTAAWPVAYMPQMVAVGERRLGGRLSWRERHNGAMWRAGEPGKPRTVRAASGTGSAADMRLAQPWRDDDLVLRLPAHDGAAEAALATLYDRYASAVFGLGLRMLGDRGLAEDLLQETFYRLWQHAAQYQPGRVRFATWLLRVATNLAISELRRTARRPRLAAPPAAPGDPDGGDGGAPRGEPADPDPDVPDLVWLAEQRRLVAAGLQRLPAEQRQAVELAYFGGLTHAEIAAAQAAPLSTVKTRLALGLRKLAAYLETRGLGGQDDGT